MTIDVDALGYTILAIVLIAGASAALSFWLRVRVHTKLLEDIRTHDFEDFSRRIDGRLACQTLSPYARELLRFQALSAQKDRKAMAEQFSRLMGMKLADPVRASLLMEGFNGFLSAGDRKHARRILDAMVPELVDSRRKAFCQKRFDATFEAAPA